jgi:hypothetical protein
MRFIDKLEWTTADFESLSRHNAHVHGSHLAKNSEDGHGTADITFDIDFILAWAEKDGSFEFTVSEALLIFHEASDLRFEVDYAARSAGMCAFSIDGLRREPLEYPNGYRSFKCVMPINWPSGVVTFDSPGFSQRLIARRFRQPARVLKSADRISLRSLP